MWKYRPARRLFISMLNTFQEERLSMGREGIGTKKIEDTVHESSSMTREENGSTEVLLPGISHDITLLVISTKLPWSTLHILSSVSKSWQGAVRGHEIHDARVRSGSRDKLVVLNHSIPDGTCGIALYCLRTDACIQIPPIPDVKNGIPQCCECITLDGKIYILGGLMEHASQLGSADVYMLDLVLGGHWQWKKCASMHACRQNFGCGVVDGKIYVCGGSSRVAPVCGTEVYDPREDAWTELMPMRSWRTGHKVGIVNNELVVYDGRIFFPIYLAITECVRLRAKLERWYVTDWTCTEPTDSTEIYNPVTNEWRLLHPDMQPPHSLGETLFFAESQLHCITGSAMFHLDLGKCSRTCLHSIEARKFHNSSDRFSPPPPTAALAVDDQLLALDYWYEYTKYMGIGQIQILAPLFLLRSRGLGTRDKEIVWERAPCSLSFEFVTSPFMCPLLL